jgi:putative transcriptional regulator
MLKSNLKVLLAERNISITQVSNDTGISRTTLTSLMSVAKGIQFETMNTLCNYLKITPSDLFIYVPYDVKIELESFRYKYDSSANFISFFIEILKENRKYKLLFNGYIHTFGRELDIKIDLAKEPETFEEKESIEIIKNSLEKLPIRFFIDIEHQIKGILLRELKHSDFYEKINQEMIENIDIDLKWSFISQRLFSVNNLYLQNLKKML